MSGRHAYCIIAHTDPIMFSRLISCIDDARNDIYVLVDKKSQIERFCSVSHPHSSLFFLPQVAINWGGYSQIAAELLLFEATSSQQYDYVHLLSGVDIPLKSQNYIHSFFDKHRGKEFVGVDNSIEGYKNLRIKTAVFYPFSEKFKNKSKFISFLRDVIVALQFKLGIIRKYKYPLYKGCNWVSITGEFSRYLLSKKSEIERMFAHTMCADEIFLQTVLMNSPYKNNIYNIDNEYSSCLRKIDWVKGNPYVWTEMDYPELSDSDALFARKFSSSHIGIVDKIIHNNY